MENFDLKDQWLTERMDKGLFDAFHKAISLVRTAAVNGDIHESDEAYQGMMIQGEEIHYWMKKSHEPTFVFLLSYSMGLYNTGDNLLKFYKDDMLNTDRWMVSAEVFLPELDNYSYPVAFTIDQLRWFCLFCKFDMEYGDIVLNHENYTELKEYWEKLCESHKEEGPIKYHLDFKDLKECLEE